MAPASETNRATPSQRSRAIAISYRRADSASAHRIYDRLAAEYGRDAIFIDIKGIPLGAHFPDHIQQVWSEIKILLVLVGPNWLRGNDAWMALVPRYVAFPVFFLLVAHYLIINALDLDATYLRIACFAIALPFGAFFYWEAHHRAAIGFAVGAILGVIGDFAMAVSTSVRYHQSLMPSDTLEWLDNVEYVVIIALGFFAGHLFARFARLPDWLHEKAWLREKEDWVRVEVATALKKRVPLIPVLVDGAAMPTRSQLPEGIDEFVYRAAARVDNGLNFESDMTRLMAAINSVLGECVH
jgi:hypothetical protein